MFDRIPVSRWIEGIRNFSDFDLDLYMWGGEPFCIDPTYDFVRDLDKLDFVKWIRIDTNLSFARKIIRRCPSPKVHLNCSWHTEVFDYPTIRKLVLELKQQEMVEMLNFVASDVNLAYLRERRYDLDTLIHEFADSGIFMNVAADFLKGNDPEYFRFITRYTTVEDWKYIHGEYPCKGAECDAGSHFFTIEHDGSLTSCGRVKETLHGEKAPEIVGDLFSGNLVRRQTQCPQDDCRSIVSYCHRTNNSFSCRRHLDDYVQRNTIHRIRTGVLKGSEQGKQEICLPVAEPVHSQSLVTREPKKRTKNVETTLFINTIENKEGAAEAAQIPGKKLKITHLNTFYPVGGAGKFTQRLVLAHRAMGHDAHVMSVCEGNEKESIHSFDPAPDTELSQTCPEKGLLDYQLQGSHRLIDQEPIRSSDIVHCSNLHGGYFNPWSISALSSAKPLVWTLHDMQAITGHCAHSLDCGKWKTGCGQCPDLKIYPGIPVDSTAQLVRDKQMIYDHSFLQIVTPADWLRKKVQQGLLRDHPVELIYNGCNTGVFKPYNKAEVRRHFKIPQEAFVVGAVAHGGTLGNPWKGGWYTKAIWEAAVKILPGGLFLNVGAEYASEGPSIFNIKPVQDEHLLALLYNAMDVFLYTPAADTCPLVVIETLACGVPIITYDTGGIPELVRDQVDGFVFPQGQIDPLVTALKTVYEKRDLLRKMGAQARQSALERFTLEKMAAHYLALYYRCMERHRRQVRTVRYFDMNRVPDVIKTDAFLKAEQAKKKIEAAAQGQEQTPEFSIVDNPDEFTVSKQRHFPLLQSAALELYGDLVDPATCDLKRYQDLLVFEFIKRHVPKGSRILDVGGGDSRILNHFYRDYECWNIDPLEGAGSGLRQLDPKGRYRLVQDYMGKFNPELPNDYFDFVFSISALEHAGDDKQTLENIRNDINRVLRPGGYSFHLFDCVIKPDRIWIHKLVRSLLTSQTTANRWAEPEVLTADPELYTMTKAAYEGGWMSVTKEPYETFGKPFSYNVLWQKAMVPSAGRPFSVRTPVKSAGPSRPQMPKSSGRTESRSRVRGDRPAEGRIPVATSLAPGNVENQQKAVQSWLQAGFQVISVNNPEEIPSLRPHFEQVRFVPVSRNGSQDHGKPVVYIDDILQTLKKTQAEVVGIINSDIHFSLQTRHLDALVRHTRDSVVCVNRMNVDPLDSEDSEMFVGGFDAFFFNQTVIDKIPSSLFCMGAPWWDYYIPMVCVLNRIPLVRFQDTIAFHIKHPLNWHKKQWLFMARYFFQRMLELCKDRKGYNPFSNLGGIFGNAWKSYHLQITLKEVPEMIIRKSMAYPEFIFGIICGYIKILDAVCPPGRDVNTAITQPDPEKSVCVLQTASLNPAAAGADKSPRTPVPSADRTLSVQSPKPTSRPSAKPQLPKITVVTPSYNQAPYLEACIQSVLNQGYPNLEYIIMDGGSTDGSVEIIKKYETHLAYWQSQPDGGQYRAVQDGFARSTGEIMTWLNSDDQYFPDAFEVAAAVFSERPDIEWLTGRVVNFSEDGSVKLIREDIPLWCRARYLKKDYRSPYLQQEGTFWRRSLWEKAGSCMRTDLHLAGDLELWTRFFRHGDLHTLDAALAGYRLQPNRKIASLLERYHQEADRILDQESADYMNQPTRPPLTPPPPYLSALELCRYRNAFRKTYSHPAGREPMALATSLAPGNIENQQKAVQSWLDAGFLVLSVNIPEEIGKLRPLFPRVCFIAASRSGREAFGKPMIYIDDIFGALKETQIEIVGIINSDIHLSPESVHLEAIAQQTKEAVVCVNRINVKRLGSEKATLFVDGFDAFFFKRSFLEQIPASRFCLGIAWWDYYVPVVCVLNRIPLVCFQDPIAYHIWHPLNWDKKQWTHANKYFFERLLELCGQREGYNQLSNLGHKFREAWKLFHLILLNDCPIAIIHKSYIYAEFIMGIVCGQMKVLDALCPDRLEKNRFFLPDPSTITHGLMSPSMTLVAVDKSAGPLVSAIVSTYQSEAFIGGCLQDLVEQTLYQKGLLEIIVVDSASPQNEGAIVRDFQSRYPNLRYIRTPQRESIYAAWNHGIRQAKGKYITNANTDDRHAPQMLEMLAAVLEEDPEKAAVYSHFYITEVPNQNWNTKTPVRLANWHPPFSRLDLLKGNFMGPQPMWRRSLHEEYGYFDPSFKVSGDWEFFVRVSQTHEFVRCRNPLGLYYHNPKSLERSAGTRAKEDQFIRQLYAKNWNTVIRRPFDPQTDSAFPETAETPMDPNPLVSVCLVAYNTESYIAQAIESVLCQTYPNLELIIVDDGSTDRTASIVRTYTDPRIRFLQQDHKNFAAGMNFAIQAAQGEFVIGVDSDDRIDPDYLKKMADFAIRNPDFDYYFPEKLTLINAQGNQTGIEWAYDEVPDSGRLLAILFAKGFSIIPNSGSLKRRSMFEKTGLFRELDNVEDFDFLTRCASQIRFKKVIGSSRYYYRKLEKSNTSRFEQRNRVTADCLERMIRIYPPTLLCPGLSQISDSALRESKFRDYIIAVFEKLALTYRDRSGQIFEEYAQKYRQNKSGLSGVSMMDIPIIQETLQNQLSLAQVHVEQGDWEKAAGIYRQLLSNKNLPIHTELRESLETIIRRLEAGKSPVQMAANL